MADIVKIEQDLTGLSWNMATATVGTSGSFPKAVKGQGANAVYYKASCYDSYNGFYGHECVNELIASRLMSILGVPHAEYSLVRARLTIDGVRHATWVNASPSYKKESEAKQSFSQFYQQYGKRDESPLGLCDRMGWGLQIRQMMLVDYLIINQDRHGANVEVLFTKQGHKRLAPVFDCGNSLVFSCYDIEEAIRKFNPMVDAIGTNFIGSKRLADNLKDIPRGIVESLTIADKEVLLRGLEDVLPTYHLEKIWEIIWSRWCEYAKL